MHPFSSNDSVNLDPVFVYPSCSYGSTMAELNELASSFQRISIDVEGIGRELVDLGKRDTDQIRQDFIRNGIDTSFNRRHTPGFSDLAPCPKWPFKNLENQAMATCASPETSEGYLQEKHANESLDSKRSVRRKRFHKENEDYCVFCYNNGEHEETYLSHACRDEKGFVMCPRLKKYVCPYCKATDKFAHTKKYCPRKPIITPADLEKMDLPRTLRF